MVFQRKPKL